VEISLLSVWDELEQTESTISGRRETVLQERKIKQTKHTKHEYENQESN
jgi:hypothetical protein